MADADKPAIPLNQKELGRLTYGRLVKALKPLGLSSRNGYVKWQLLRSVVPNLTLSTTNPSRLTKSDLNELQTKIFDEFLKTRPAFALLSSDGYKTEGSTKNVSHLY